LSAHDPSHGGDDAQDHGDHAHDHDHSHGHGDDDHVHHHGHGHSHTAGAPTRALGAALVLTASFMVVEAVVGVWSGGLALVADAAHMLADAAALGIALVASVWAKRPRTHSTTFGHRRAEVLAAFLNGIALALTAIWVVVEAMERWRTPHEVRAVPMAITAGLGLCVNLGVAAILAGSRSESLNVRAAFAHVAMDALGSVAALSAALLILFFDMTRADPVLSVVIAVLVALSGWRVLRETTSILLEAAPAHIDVSAVERTICECPGVGSVHDLHVWRISDAFDALTVHVTLAAGAHGVEVCRAVALRLRQVFGLEHVTVQPEAPPPPELVTLRLRRTETETAGR
jgi:cobalt-zinc-cadmium efflux system protein